MNVYTIGFTQTTAEHFFGLIRDAGLKRVIDVRLNNVSQLAGFAKRDDLAYFLDEICGIDYMHEPRLAPTQELLRAYQRKEMNWDEYAARYLDLLEMREVENDVDLADLDRACLLCSENTAEKCHRRLALEYLQMRGSAFTIDHLR